MARFSLALLLVAATCAERKPPAAPVQAAPSTPPSTGGRVIFQPPRGEVPFRVEVVDTDEGRRQGLMNRRSLPMDQGMLFLFPVEEVQSFWMHDTYVPLDMIFINTRREVVGVVENAAPLTDESRSVGRPSRYVLEVNAHLAREIGIEPGTKVRFEGIFSALLLP